MGDASPLIGLYDWTYELTGSFKKSSIADALGLGHTYVPFHRASTALTDYVLISVYVGALHLLIGYVIGFFNVMKAHGIVAAFFEKGSWMMILLGGFFHIYGYMNNDNEVLAATIPAMIMMAGVVILIIALALFEGFGWAGGVIRVQSKPSDSSLTRSLIFELWLLVLLVSKSLRLETTWALLPWQMQFQQVITCLSHSSSSFGLASKCLQ
jgi:hypothetical protein